MTITGVKTAVGSYNRLNAGGRGRRLEGRIMLDRSSGRVWTDEYVRGTRGDYVYPDEVITLSRCMERAGYAGRHTYIDIDPDYMINMRTVRREAERIVAEWAAEHEEV